MNAITASKPITVTRRAPFFPYDFGRIPPDRFAQRLARTARSVVNRAPTVVKFVWDAITASKPIRARRRNQVSPHNVIVIDDRFELTGQPLAKTAMSIVERAIDLENNRRSVVVKSVWEKNPEISRANSNQIIFTHLEKAQQALMMEAEILGRKLHPMFPEPYASGRRGNRYFIAMEDIQGITLHALLNKPERIPLHRAIEIVMQVCYGLNALHRANFVHRDLKPTNILVNSSQVRLIDFGIACEKGYQDKGLIAGTPTHLAPEQCQYQPLDQRTDIYALGLVLAQMITSVKPSKIHDVIRYLAKHKYADAAPDELDPAAVERECFDHIKVKLEIKGIKQRFSEEKQASLKEKIDQAEVLLQKIVDKMLQFNKEDRFNNINQVIPLLKKARKIARKLAPYESLV